MQRKGSPVIEKLSLNIAELIVKSKPKHGNSQDMLFLRYLDTKSTIRTLFQL